MTVTATARGDRHSRSPLRATIRALLWRAESGIKRLVGAKIAGERLFYSLDIERAPVTIAASPAEFRELSCACIEAPAPGEGEAEFDGERLERGQAVGLIDGKVVYRVSYVRGAGQRLRGLPAGWEPRHRVILLHDGYTEPQFRNRGIHSAALRWLLARARAEQIEQAVCVVRADNPIARRAVTQLGFRCVGSIH